MVLIGYDFRGRWGSELTPAFMRNLGKKLARFGSMILGRDARIHSPRAKRSLLKGLLAGGCMVKDVGLIATPVVCWLAMNEKKMGGMITASHNPPEWNGLKLFKENGCGLLPEEYEEIMESNPHDSSLGSLKLLDPESYFEALEKKFNDFFGLSIVVDPGGGVGSLVMPKVLERFGCDFSLINSELDGKFRSRSPEPKPEELRKLQLKVLYKNADCGVALDGDADRLIVIDDSGMIVDGNKLLALFAREEKEAVVPWSASQAIDDVCKRVERCRVGDVFVSDKLVATPIGFGGEPSGHFSFKEWLPYPDPAFAFGKLLSLLKEDELSRLLDEIPQYPAETESFTCNNRDAKIAKFKEKFDSQPIGDGIRISFPNGWAVVRKSNTQPLLRLKYEAESKKALEKIKNLIKNESRSC